MLPTQRFGIEIAVVFRGTVISLSSDLDTFQVDMFDKRICIEGVKIDGRERGQRGVVGIKMERRQETRRMNGRLCFDQYCHVRLRCLIAD